MELLSSVSSGLIYFWNSFLFTNIAGGEDVSQWTIKAGMNSLFDYDIHLVPINLTGHWILAKVDLKNRDITTYDPLWRDIGHEQSIYTVKAINWSHNPTLLADVCLETRGVGG